MPKARIHVIGNHVGTCVDLAAYTGIAPANFGRRLQKFYDGCYTVEQCMRRGALSKVRTNVEGNSEWASLSRYDKDAHLSLAELPTNWLCK